MIITAIVEPTLKSQVAIVLIKVGISLPSLPKGFGTNTANVNDPLLNIITKNNVKNNKAFMIILYFMDTAHANDEIL